MDSSSNCQNRRSHRAQVLLAATLEHGGASRPVKLRNMSAEGALVESDALPIEGTAVLFCRKELSASGRVVWVNGRFAGIAFDETLDPDQVLRHIPAPAPRPKVLARPYRPGFTPRTMNPDQQRLAESWVWSPGPIRPGE
jgi:hypothetical protein